MISLAAAAALAAMPKAAGDDVPFAQPPVLGAQLPLSAAQPALADIMAGVQLRHIKLWQAIEAANWPLVQFEATLIADSLTAAAMLYRNIPIDHVMAAARPLGELKFAAALADVAKPAALFADLTAACNACHAAAGIPFVAIATPSSSPFSDQRFAPAAK
jgi:hypothetical protein